MTRKIIGIGNAIVDVICQVEDEFLQKNNFAKASMSLIDQKVADDLSKLQITKITSGGSAANTIAGLAQLKIDCDFIGKVAQDEFGKKYIKELEKTSTKFVNKNFSKDSSAKSFILLTPDAQRTMATFLGCAYQIEEEDIDENIFKSAKILYLEGYLWDAPQTILALKKAISLAKKHNVKIAFSLSDSFCVIRHKKDFLNLIENDLDILFANEAEASELTNGDEDFFLKQEKLITIITKSEKGCVILKNNVKKIELEAQKIEKLIDTTGAGDAFATGFLYGFINGYNLEKSGYFGNLLASKIIQKFGARFENDEIKL